MLKKLMLASLALLLVVLWGATFGRAAGEGTATGEEETEMTQSWEIWEIDDLLAQRAAGGRLYHEFIRVPALNAGVYELAAGSKDPQPVHDEDEIYYILEGKGSFFVDGEERKVGKGDVIYVKAHVEHRFFDIEEDLKVLVFFSTAATGD